MRKLPLVFRSALRQAFSLVEVTIALGIVTFAVVSVAGLIPVGLGTLRDSKVQMLETQIFKAVTAQNAVGNFTNLSFTAWFDSEGQPATNNALYKVVVSDASGPPIFPGSSNAFQLTDSLKTARVEITDMRTQCAKTNFLWVSQNGK